MFTVQIVEHMLTIVDPNYDFAPKVDLSGNDFSGPIPEFFSRENVPQAVHSVLLLGVSTLYI